MLAKLQHCPYAPAPKQYGAKAQAPLPIDISQKLSQDEIKEIQRVIGSILYYACTVDITVLMALSSIAIKQSKGTSTNTMAKAKQLLNYLATYPDATICFCASDMIMNVHSDASYLSESEARSWACGHFFMGWSPKDGNPIKLNGAFFTLCAILRFVVSSTAEAKLGALFLNCKEGMIFRLPSKSWDMHNPKLLSIATMPPLLALQTTLLNVNAPIQWRCGTSGFVIRSCKMHMMSDDILARKTLLITRVNTISGHTILLSALGIYMMLIRPWYSSGRSDLAL
jgi:hypothetical protein